MTIDFAFEHDAMRDRISRSMGVPASVLTTDRTNYASSKPENDRMRGIYDRMFGYQIVVNTYLCQTQFVRWARWPKSRRKRIRMKWRKKYGAVMKCVATDAFKIGSILFACPHVAERMKAVST